MTAVRWIATLALASLPLSPLHGQSEYDRHVFFDHGLTPDRYFHSAGKRTGASALLLDRGRLPVDTLTFLTPPNALRLEWRSVDGGDWGASVHLNRWRNRPELVGDTLSFWCFSGTSLPAALLPRLALQDTAGVASAPLDLAGFAPDLSAARWVQLRIPLQRFRSSTGGSLDRRALATLTFLQGRPDGATHSLAIDDRRAGRTPGRRLRSPHRSGLESGPESGSRALRHPPIARRRRFPSHRHPAGRLAPLCRLPRRTGP
jgi:exo beta-1,2-glucooligosaccharide sophorohydrolase (non-reducing end)